MGSLPKFTFILLSVFLIQSKGGLSAQEVKKEKAPAARAEQVSNASIEVSELQDFDKQPGEVQKLIQKGMDLTRMNLKYKYGSADPSQGGMDCSGTIYYLLQQQGLKDLPRSSDDMYHWVVDKGTLHAVDAESLDSPEFSELKAGDLLFWSGTYAVSGISHVMIYLGRLKDGGKMVMIGSSDGRRYAGVARNGVSVFDFVLPKSGGGAKFVGYGAIPGFLNPKSDPPTVTK